MLESACWEVKRNKELQPAKIQLVLEIKSLHACVRVSGTADRIILLKKEAGNDLYLHRWQEATSGGNPDRTVEQCWSCWLGFGLWFLEYSRRCDHMCELPGAGGSWGILLWTCSWFSSKDLELERTIKGSCWVTFPLGMDEENKLGSENCLAVMAGVGSGALLCHSHRPRIVLDKKYRCYSFGVLLIVRWWALNCSPWFQAQVGSVSIWRRRWPWLLGICSSLMLLCRCCSWSGWHRIFPWAETSTKPVLCSSWGSSPLTHVPKMHKHLDEIMPHA